ncbi:MobA-like NTP transferase domain protein [Gemmatirosa kalamazoonensis]|uniref:MobA-like NTP transferase domain protein n=1 Tax=Gemmatirosa kalamazoonensis TaxID=861299 RepID=W0RHA7_9BACT|nr:nucleotidyltransferase family protein [Gemmatirosa kalamazoonensis]AHG89695.1 MobA-like NTP transferase domain protein [Gemmatirosa kalamazoonensis]
MDMPVKRVAAVVLAAGASTRLGRPKQLVLHDGEPLVRRAARAALDAGAEPAVVVLGAHADLVRRALDGLPVSAVMNDAWETGMASSLRVGARAALDAGADAVLVTLVDQPLVDAAALRRLVAAFPGPYGVVASTYGDALGVPALFAREHAEALLHLTGDAGAGGWLRARGAAVTRVAMDEAALDVDTEGDLARLDG